MKHLSLNEIMFLFLPNFPAGIIEVQEGHAKGLKSESIAHMGSESRILEEEIRELQ